VEKFVESFGKSEVVSPIPGIVKLIRKLTSKQVLYFVAPAVAEYSVPPDWALHPFHLLQGRFPQARMKIL